MITKIRNENNLDYLNSVGERKRSPSSAESCNVVVPVHCKYTSRYNQQIVREIATHSAGAVRDERRQVVHVILVY